MKIKVILGIILPILVVITLTLLGSYDGGFSTKKSFIASINYSEVFKKTYSNDAYRIGEIEISNDYFLPKRYEASAFLSCKYDKEGVRPAIQAGYVFYNEGVYSEEVQILDVNKIASSSYYRPHYGNGNDKISVEVAANQKKKLQIYLSSEYSYGSGQFSNYEYDYLLIIPNGNNKNKYCESLTSEDIADAAKIDIKMPKSYCFDSDRSDYSASNDYYTLRNEYNYVGTCTDNLGNTYTDSCKDSENLTEYSCSVGANEACSPKTISCKSFGFNRCEAGTCVY